jgi:hypothetical protein
VNRSDLIAVVPWLLFAVGLSLVGLRLLRARYVPRRQTAPRKRRRLHGRADSCRSLDGTPAAPGPAADTAQSTAGSGQHGAGSS